MSSKIHFEQRNSAFNRRIYTFAVVNRDHIDIRQFLHDAFDYFDAEIRGILQERHMVKVNAILSVVFEKPIENSENNLREIKPLHINSAIAPIQNNTDLTEFYSEYIVNYFLSQVDEVMIEGSGFTLSEINELVVQVNRYEPLRGSSFVELSKELKDKGGIVNVVNKDEKCFEWAVLSALYPASSNPSRLSHYKKYENKLNFTGIDFPVKLNQIDKFEKLNPNISINIYMYESETDTNDYSGKK